jgi:hypothetical protein
MQLSPKAVHSGHTGDLDAGLSLPEHGSDLLLSALPDGHVEFTCRS